MSLVNPFWRFLKSHFFYKRLSIRKVLRQRNRMVQREGNSHGIAHLKGVVGQGRAVITISIVHNQMRSEKRFLLDNSAKKRHNENG